MSTISKIKIGAKRTAAVALTALMSAACVNTAMLSMRVEAAGGMLSNEERGVIFADSRSDFRDESIYFLITTRFYDGDSSNNARTSEDTKAKNPDSDPSWRGDFKGLIDKLDYIKALGFTAIWITPVVENNSGYDYHGYHASNFKAVDNRYESNGVTYQTLIDACHAKGIKVIQDVVFNHTCNFGEKGLIALGGDALAKQITSDVYPTRNQVVMNGTGDPNNIYHHTGFCGGGDWDNFEAQRKTIADDCFDLNTENPVVYNYLVDAYKGYIDMGVDAFRVDTVKHISRLTLNTAILPELTAEAKKNGNDSFYMFGEVCTKGHDVWYRDAPPISTAFYTWDNDASYKSRWSSSDYATNESLVAQHYTEHMDTGSQPTSTNAFLNGNNYHAVDYSNKSDMSVIDFQMHWSFMNANNAFNTALGQDRYFNDSTWNVVYVDSHDYGPDECQTQRYTGGTDAWAENLALMFTFRGIPCVYYGSEVEFQKGMPIDVGPNSPLSQTGRAYYGDYLEGNVVAGDFTVFNATGKVAETLNSPLSQQIMRLNRIRQAVPALRKGQYSTEGCSGSMAFKRRYTDSNTDSFACVCISGGATFSGIPNGTYVDAVTGDTKTVSNGTLTASCSGKGNLRVYVLSTSKTPAPGRVVPNGKYITDGGAAENIGGDNIQVVVPTGISLNTTSTTVREAESVKLTATVTPSDATNKNVTWTSSNPDVATVSGGTVTGVSTGTATITASTYNGKSATCKVTVTTNSSIVKPTGISLSTSSLTLEAGQSDSLTATVQPSNATNKTVTWSSSDSSVASVSGGSVTAVAAGTATITATTFNGYSASCTVTVTPKSVKTIENGVYFEKPSGWNSDVHIYLYDSSTDSTVGSEWPGVSMTDNGDDVYIYEYTTSNSNLMIVFNDGNGQQAPSSYGFKYTNCGYYTSSGYQRTVEPVTDILPTSVSVSSSSASVNVGSSVTVTATVQPSNATNKTVSWTSSDTSVATVSGGVITGRKAGTAVITASTSNGKTATVTVTVKAVNTALQNKTTISATSVPKCTWVTLTGAASGGSGGYKYSFYYKKSTSAAWTSVGEIYGNQTTVSFGPASTGTYLVRTNVKDSKGTVVRKEFTLKSTSPTSTSLQNKSTVGSTTIVKGTPIKITGKASGGNGSYKYAFYYKKTTSKAFTSIGTEYGTATTASFTPGSAADYNVRINVKDSNGTIVTMQYKLTTGGSTASLTNQSTVSATSVSVGDKVTLKGAASGGSGSYKYAFYYKKSTNSNYTVLGTAYGTATTASFTAGSAGTYNVKIDVKDTNGTVVSKTFIVQSASTTGGALTNASTISSTNVTLGSSFTVTAKATGGTSPYYYAFYYKKTTSSSWVVSGTEYGSATTATIKPGTSATYDVMVKIMDNTGETVIKTFTVKVV